MNKATKFNRYMGLAMLALGILVIALVFGMLYLSFQIQADQAADTTATGDSIIVVEDYASPQ